jgi:hypothetical protein
MARERSEPFPSPRPSMEGVEEVLKSLESGRLVENLDEVSGNPFSLLREAASGRRKDLLWVLSSLSLPDKWKPGFNYEQSYQGATLGVRVEELRKGDGIEVFLKRPAEGKVIIDMATFVGTRSWRKLGAKLAGVPLISYGELGILEGGGAFTRVVSEGDRNVVTTFIFPNGQLAPLEMSIEQGYSREVRADSGTVTTGQLEVSIHGQGFGLIIAYQLARPISKTEFDRWQIEMGYSLDPETGRFIAVGANGGINSERRVPKEGDEVVLFTSQILKLAGEVVSALPRSISSDKLCQRLNQFQPVLDADLLEFGPLG